MDRPSQIALLTPLELLSKLNVQTKLWIIKGVASMAPGPELQVVNLYWIISRYHVICQAVTFQVGPAEVALTPTIGVIFIAVINRVDLLIVQMIVRERLGTDRISMI